jgi:ppGpp synthetase/RelA/SpoT-type nucleotidyltranferase
MSESERECLKWARDQIDKYKQLYPKYKLCAETLHRVLEKAAKKYAPLSIVETRAKSISSFGEKIYRKKDECNNPVDEFTDLCGGRVITPTHYEVEKMCDFIESHFDIDRDNSVDARKRLMPSEFGYLSVHYIVSFKRGVFPTKEINVMIPDEVFCLKSEIQVRTLLEHAWADFAHDRSYKGQFKVPAKWEHELATLAATLEAADNTFSRIEKGLQTYAASYAANMNEKEILFEIKKLEIILDYDPENLEIAHRIGKLAITLGDWGKAIKVLKEYENSDYQPILRDLGVATCKKYRKDPQSMEYKQGLRYLERACAPPNKDSDALSSYAGALKGIDDDKAKELYYQAFRLDPSNSYPLGNYLEYQIAQDHDTRSVAHMHVEVEAALQRCREQAEVGMNLPWVYHDIGKLELLLGNPYESLSAYTKAVQCSTAVFMVSTSLRSLKTLEVIRDRLVGYDWMVKLLSVGQLIKALGDEERKEYLASAKELSGGNGLPSDPIVIVAGGCDAYAEAQLQGFRLMIVDAFDDFKGTLISGGTKSGICDFVGETAQKYPNSIHAIGYIPGKMCADVTIDERYTEIRRTEGDGFSPLDALQYWIDIIACGFDPSQVKLLGINGGSIAAAEYKIALALGACVAIVDESGGEAERLLSNPEWEESKMLIRLPKDTMTMRYFVGRERPKLPQEIREEVGRAIQLDFKRSRTGIYLATDPAMADWDKLREDLKESNLQQADDILKKLESINCTVHKVTDRPIASMTFTTKEIEDMAEMEHARWNVERLLGGWKWARERDIPNKRSPYIVGWLKLPEDIKEYDRVAVRKIPEFLAEVHLEIRRKP